VRELLRERVHHEVREFNRQQDRVVFHSLVAEYLGSSAWKVRQLIANRRIPFLQYGDGPFLSDTRDLDGFIERSKRIM
jgi:excisionase family DNA binding protein